MKQQAQRGRRKGQKKVAGKEAFLERMDEVKELMERGFSMKTIWERKLAHTGMSYDQALVYVHRFILKDYKPKPKQAKASRQEPVQASKQTSEQVPRQEPKAFSTKASKRAWDWQLITAIVFLVVSIIGLIYALFIKP